MWVGSRDSQARRPRARREADGRSSVRVGGLTRLCLRTETLAEAEVLSTGPREAFLTCHLSTGDAAHIHASQAGLPDV